MGREEAGVAKRAWEVVEMRVYLTGAVREPGVCVVGPGIRIMEVIAAVTG